MHGDGNGHDAAPALRFQDPPPRANPLLLGQEVAEAALLAATDSGRLHHGWMLAGPGGIGKATLAFRFARHLLAGGDTPPPPGLFGEPEPAQSMALAEEDPVFRRVASGGHADLLTVARPTDESGRPQGQEIPVASVRKIAEFLHLTPAEGGHRIAILDEAHRLNRSGQNALLKILEEPPGQAVLMLVTDQPGLMLPTIRSRCRILPMPALSDGTVAGLLERYIEGLDPASRGALVTLGEGSIGRALTLCRQDGVAMMGLVLELLGSLGAAGRSAREALIDRLGTGDASTFDLFCDLLLWWLARSIRARARDRMPAPVMQGEGELALRLFARAGPQRWIDLLDALRGQITTARRANLDRRQTLIGVFATLERIA